MELLLNDQTKQNISDYLDEPSHCLVLSGSVGSGKYQVAQEICLQFINISKEKLPNYPYYKHIVAEDDSISIETVRQLQNYLSLKALSGRAVVIEDADNMTREAQNAILKTLEEPPEGTIIILTTAQPQNLLPTVRSRAVNINVRPVSPEQAKSYLLPRGHKGSDIQKAYLLSGGCAGLLCAILENPETHPLATMVNNVKSLLGVEPFDRLIRVQEIIKDRQDLSLALIALQKVASAGLKAATQKQNSEAEVRWTNLLAKTLKAQEDATAHPSTKLLLTDLMLHV